MAKANLPVNFKDDILKENMNGKRRFNMIQNSDGTVSFEDVTDYTQVGSTFGAAQINATNEAVNNAADASKIIDSLETIKANTQSGYIAGALAVKKLNSNLGSKPVLLWTNEEDSKGAISTISNKTIELTDIDKYNAFIIEAQRSTVKNEIVGRALLFKTDRSTTPFFWIGGVTGDNDPTIRKIYVTDTGIYFQNPTPSGAGGSLVPKRIYGINIELN